MGEGTAVDVVDNPGIEVLDLRHCSAGVHVAIRRCPRLSRLLLPDCGDGATVHVDFGECRPRLEIRGQVADFDACWLDPRHGGSLQLNTPSGRPKRGPLRHAWIGDVDGISADAELVMIVDPGCTEDFLELPNVRELAVYDTPTLSGIRLPTQRPNAAMRLVRCPDLEYLAVTNTMRRIRVEYCPRLREVVGGGATLSVSHGSSDVETLDARGVWLRSRLAYCPTRAIFADLTETVSIGLCPNMARVRALAGSHVVFWGDRLPVVEGGASIVLEPLTDQMLVEAIGSEHPDLHEAVIAWCERRIKPARALRALQLLAAALETGCDPERIWHARTVLGANVRGPRRFERVHLRGWTWPLPGDLSDRGWAADLRIWHGCRLHVPEAAAYEIVLTAHGDPEHLLALAGAWREATPRSEDDRLFAGLLRRALTSGATFGSPIDVQRKGTQGPWPLDENRLKSVIEALAAGRRRPTRVGLPAILADWIARRLPGESGFDLLGLMRVLGCARATELLHATITDAEARPEVRRLALKQVLTSVGEPLLAEPESNGGNDE